VTDTDMLEVDFVARPALRDGRVVGYVTQGILTAAVAELMARQRHRPGPRAAAPGAPRA
jgi:hypothetical protein